MHPNVEPQTFWFESDGKAFPNNPSLPALVYPHVLDPHTQSLADTFEDRYRENRWAGTWRWGVYAYHHFHCDAHEALGVATGHATIQLGGPQGQAIDVKAGDLMVLPAGTGHKNLRSSYDFLVVGSYPAGQASYSMNRGDLNEFNHTIRAIAQTPLPKTDPIYGSKGPLTQLWMDKTS